MFFPVVCNGCGTDLLSANHLLCLHCQSNLNETQFASLENNPVEKIWWGRIPLVAAMSQFYFTKDSLLQNLIHQLKYKGNKELGKYLGKFMGHSLRSSGRFGNIDAIVPLPLFSDKLKTRGYNQATMLSMGISEILRVPVMEEMIGRTRQTDTQTHKTRTERWQNVEGVFASNHSKEFRNKNVLLVDDVVTTGATLEACGSALIEDIPGTRLSIATLAYAEK